MMVILTKKQEKNRVQWVRDLLSGKFNQGEGVLKRFGNGSLSYCCLGVACERLMPDSSKLRLTRGKSDKYMSSWKAFVEFGLVYGDQKTAAVWNDGHYGVRSYRFSRIADFIAYATSSRVRFSKLKLRDVPNGYAQDWLHAQGRRRQW